VNTRQIADLLQVWLKANQELLTAHQILHEVEVRRDYVALEFREAEGPLGSRVTAMFAEPDFRGSARKLMPNLSLELDMLVWDFLDERKRQTELRSRVDAIQDQQGQGRREGGQPQSSEGLLEAASVAR
jgi:exoribonuclease R